MNAVDVNWLTIGVEDLRAAVSADGFFDGLDTKAHLRSPLSLINARDKLADGQPPGKHPATEPVDDGDEVYKAFGHGHVRDVDRPDLVRPDHRQIAQEVGINLVAWFRPSPTFGYNSPDQGAGSSVFAAGHQPNSVRGYRCCSVRANPGASRLALSCYDRAFAISGLLSVRLMSWRTSGMPLRKMISGFELSQIAPKSFFSNAVRDLCCGSTFLFGSLDYLTKGLA